VPVTEFWASRLRRNWHEQNKHLFMDFLLDWLKNQKDAIEAAQAIATMLAILVGGFWAYLIFVKKRQRFPRAKLSHSITSRQIVGGKSLFRFTIHIENPSEVILRLRSGFVWIQQMQPVPQSIEKDILSGTDPVESGEAEILWPMIAERKLNFTKLGTQIEPGEWDELHAEFAIDSKVTKMLIYTHLDNAKKRSWFRFWEKTRIGWNLSTVHCIDSARVK
jgi:hypothetical protein